jgi:hypothetical protein
MNPTSPSKDHDDASKTRNSQLTQICNLLFIPYRYDR